MRRFDGNRTFPEYVEIVKRRFARHGFTRTFQLDEDLTRQDKLTTWIEYLHFEYCWYDWHTLSLKNLQSGYDEAWKKLVDSGVLRSSETEEFLRTTESSMRRQNEKDRAWDALKSAKSAARAALIPTNKARDDPHAPNLTLRERVRRLAAAQSQLNAAQESFESTKRRGDLISEFICGTRGYLDKKTDVKRHSLLLRWILEQVPLIEAELEESKAAEASLHAGLDTKPRPKRVREDDIPRDQHRLKRQKIMARSVRSQVVLRLRKQEGHRGAVDAMA